MSSSLCLCLLLWLTIVPAGAGAGFLTYDPQGQQLHFRCPEPDSVPSRELSLFAKVTRVPRNGGNVTELAELKIVGQKGYSHSLHDRVRVPEGPTDDLRATLKDVTCHDSVAYNYTCVTIDNNEPHPTYRVVQQFQFIGESTQPYLTQDPFKSRYGVGELLTLNCTAFVGTEDNGVVWEAGFPRGPFSPVTGEDNPETDSAYEEVQVEHAHCIRQSVFPLVYRVKAEDDGKIFQCRLQRTMQTTRFAMAVKTDGEMCSSSMRSKKGGDTANTKQGVHLKVTNTESKQSLVKRADGGEEEGALSSSTTMIIVIVVLVVVVTVSVSVIFVLHWQWRKKQQQPLVVVETPSSSEHGFPLRDLPSLPDLPAAGPRRSDTTPKRIVRNTTPHLNRFHLEGPQLNSISNNNNNYSTYPDLASSSVYVSMSAVDRLDDMETGTSDAVGHDGGPAGHAGPEVEKEPPPEVGDLAPDMRADRSGTLYSNQAAWCKEGAKGDKDEEESVYVPSMAKLK